MGACASLAGNCLTMNRSNAFHMNAHSFHSVSLRTKGQSTRVYLQGAVLSATSKKTFVALSLLSFALVRCQWSISFSFSSPESPTPSFPESPPLGHRRKPLNRYSQATFGLTKITEDLARGVFLFFFRSIEQPY